MSHLLNNIIFDHSLLFHLPSPLFHSDFTYIVAFDRTSTCYIFIILILMDRWSKTSLPLIWMTLFSRNQIQRKRLTCKRFGDSLVIYSLNEVHGLFIVEHELWGTCSVVMVHRLVCAAPYPHPHRPLACEIFPDQGSNPCPLP